MKHRSFYYLVGALCILLSISCEKKLEPAIPTVHEMAQKLYTSDHFIAFAKRFIPDLKYEIDYLNVPSIKINRAAFTLALENAGDNDAKTESVFTAYGLSMNEAIMRRNKVDNDLLQLFNQEKELLKYKESEIWAIIREGIDMGWQSQSQNWQEVRSITMQSPVTIAVNGEAAKQVHRLTIDEAWGCLKEAVGVGNATVLGIAGLTKLAEQGIQAVVISVSKWLAARAGWIGVIVMTLDFSACLYKKTND